MYPTFYSRNIATVTSKTLALTDCGTVQNVATDAQTITLPSAAATTPGASFTIRNGGTNNGDVGITIAANAADSVNGLGFTAANGKGVVNTKATARPGDEITLVTSGAAGAGAWTILNAVGTFARVP